MPSFDDEIYRARKNQADKIAASRATKPDRWEPGAEEAMLLDEISAIEEFKYQACPHCAEPVVWVGSTHSSDAVVESSSFECYPCNRYLRYDWPTDKASGYWSGDEDIDAPFCEEV